MVFSNQFPCAFCVTHIDKDFTIISANDIFYQLVGYSSHDIEFKFANRYNFFLGAKNAKTLLKMISDKDYECQDLECVIKYDDKEIWLHTQVDFSNIDVDSTLTFISFDITKHKNIEKKLYFVESRTEHLLELGDFDVFEYNYDTLCLENGFSKYLFQKTPTIGTKFPDIFYERQRVHVDSTSLLKENFERLKSGETKTFSDLCLKDKNDNYKWFRSSLFTICDKNQKQVIHLFTDITAEKEATANYLYETLFYQAMLSDQDAYGHLDVTDNHILKVGGIWNLYNEIIDQISYSDLFKEFCEKVVHPEDRESYWEVMDPINLMNSFHGGIFHLGTEFRRIIEQNKMYWMYITIHLFQNPMNHHVMALMYIKNIDMQKKIEQKSMSQNVEFDALTNLYNLSTSKKLIKEYLTVMNPDEFCTLALLDVDNLHRINEVDGEAKGNDILIHISEILNNAFRKSDIIGRYDSDQFILLLKNYDYHINLRVRLDLLMKTLVNEIDPAISMSIGIAIVESGSTYEHCFRHADIALFAAKYAGKGCYVFYHEEILNAEARNQFEQKYQHISKEKIMTLDSKRSLEQSTSIIEEFNLVAGEEGDIGYLVDPKNYDLICGNQAFYNRIGKSIEECKGKKCYELMHERTAPCPFCRKANWNEEKYYLYRNYNRMLNQEFLIKNKLIEWRGAEVLLAFAVDLSNDKNIADSIENDTTENNYILNGIHVMQSAQTMELFIDGALDTIGNFFRANNVRLWTFDSATKTYLCEVSWVSHKSDQLFYSLESHEIKAIDNWLKEHKWKHCEIVESPEAMLCFSYDIYQIMKKSHITNQRWCEMMDGDICLGIIEINDVTINFQNSTFMESFLSFVISEWRKRDMLEKIIYARDYDSLTGLLNRNSYDAFSKTFQSDNNRSIASICVNIDKLSEINKNNGDKMGDYFLRKVAEFLKKNFMDETIYRLNGDEFFVVILNQDMTYLLNKLNHFKLDIEEFDMFTVSTGYAWDDVEKNLNEIIATSNLVMKNNKAQYYHSNDVVDDLGIQNAQMQLMSSIEKREYEVWLQPKFDTRLGRVFGAEALIRYRDKELGILPPVKYIPLLEERKLIRYIDLFVFEEVLKILDKWLESDRNCPYISLNFSRVTLMEENIIENMENIFNRYHVPKKYIEIEILESSADVGKAVLYQAIRNLHQAGYSVSLDDFGINYTNLSILTDVDVDTLKVDKSLVHSLETQPKNQTVLKHIIQMCDELHIRVIMEGVETKMQRDIIVGLGCHQFQGYLYSKPIEVSEFEEKYLVLDNLKAVLSR